MRVFSALNEGFVALANQVWFPLLMAILPEQPHYLYIIHHYAITFR